MTSVLKSVHMELKLLTHMQPMVLEYLPTKLGHKNGGF